MQHHHQQLGDIADADPGLSGADVRTVTDAFRERLRFIAILGNREAAAVLGLWAASMMAACFYVLFVWRTVHFQHAYVLTSSSAALCALIAIAWLAVLAPRYFRVSRQSIAEHAAAVERVRDGVTTTTTTGAGAATAVPVSAAAAGVGIDGAPGTIASTSAPLLAPLPLTAGDVVAENIARSVRYPSQITLPDRASASWRALFALMVVAPSVAALVASQMNADAHRLVTATAGVAFAPALCVFIDHVRYRMQPRRVHDGRSGFEALASPPQPQWTTTGNVVLSSRTLLPLAVFCVSSLLALLFESSAPSAGNTAAASGIGVALCVAVVAVLRFAYTALTQPCGEGVDSDARPRPPLRASNVVLYVAFAVAAIVAIPALSVDRHSHTGDWGNGGDETHAGSAIASASAARDFLVVVYLVGGGIVAYVAAVSTLYAVRLLGAVHASVALVWVLAVVRAVALLVMASHRFEWYTGAGLALSSACLVWYAAACARSVAVEYARVVA
jgi:hypothetical protein